MLNTARQDRFSRAGPKLATVATIRAGDGTSTHHSLSRQLQNSGEPKLRDWYYGIERMRASITLPSAAPVCRVTGRCDAHITGVAALPKVAIAAMTLVLDHRWRYNKGAMNASLRMCVSRGFLNDFQIASVVPRQEA